MSVRWGIHKNRKGEIMSFLHIGKNSFHLLWFIENNGDRTFVYGCVKCNELMGKEDCIKHMCSLDVRKTQA